MKQQFSSHWVSGKKNRDPEEKGNGWDEYYTATSYCRDSLGCKTRRVTQTRAQKTPWVEVVELKFQGAQIDWSS